MLNYIRSELYRSFKTKGNYIYFAIITVLLLLPPVLSKFDHDSAELQPAHLYGIWTMMALIGVYVSLAVFSAILRKSRGVQIQVLSQGISRAKVFLGDFVVLSLKSLALIVYVAFLSLLTAFIFTGRVDEMVMQAILSNDVIQRSHSALLLYLQALLFYCFFGLSVAAFALFCTYWVKNLGVAMAIFFVVGMFLPSFSRVVAGDRSFLSRLAQMIVNLMPYTYLNDFAFSNQVSGVPFLEISRDALVAWIGNVTLWTGLGLLTFYRKKY